MTVALSGIPTLETERLILRGPRMEDVPFWTAFTMTERSQYVRAPEMTEGLAWRAFAHVAGMWALRGFGSFVISLKGNDAPLGMAGPWYPVGWPEQEIGWSLWHQDAEGKGYAYEAALAARSYAYDILGWDTAVSYIARGNARSIALAERLGATLDAAATGPSRDELVYRHPSPADLVDGGMEAYA